MGLIDTLPLHRCWERVRYLIDVICRGLNPGPIDTMGKPVEDVSDWPPVTCVIATNVSGAKMSLDRAILSNVSWSSADCEFKFASCIRDENWSVVAHPEQVIHAARPNTQQVVSFSHCPPPRILLWNSSKKERIVKLLHMLTL